MSENTTTKTARITKSMKFDALAAAISGEAIPHNLTKDDLLSFISAEKALLVKKNTAERKPTEKQKENESFKKLIISFLGECEKGVTCTDIRKGIPELTDLENQRVAALMRALKEDGRVTKTMEKGKALFSLA